MAKDTTLVLYPFRKRDPLTGRCYRARWMASSDDTAKLGGVVDGEAVIYQHLGATSGFQAHRTPFSPPDEIELHPNRADPPTINDSARYLAKLFLRRYATYCTRRRRYTQAQGAARLSQN